MFDKNFYPTPEYVIRNMIAPYLDRIERGNISILEPSCGKGDIIKYIAKIEERARYSGGIKFYAFEKNEELYLLSSEIPKVKMIGYDFLEYRGDIYFDLIVMNPPFDKGATHLLHAWDILDSGDIVCLLNSETIDNPRTDDAKRLKHLINQVGGNVEYYGDCFSEAERKMNVNVACVRLNKISENNTFNFEKVDFVGGKAVDLDFESGLGNEIANRDIIGNMVLALKQVEDTAKEFIRSMKKMQHYSKMVNYGVTHKFYEKGETDQMLYNRLVEDAHACAWNQVFEKMDFARDKTSKIQKDFRKFVAANSSLVFSKENVWKMLEFLQENQAQIIQQAFVELFDKLTQYSEKNIIPSERWKTNSHYKVNKKIIMPNCGREERYSGGYVSFHVDYDGRFREWGDDLDKLCGHIAGVSFSDIENKDQTIYRTVYEKCRGNIEKFPKDKFQSKFFSIRVYKKGTVHLEFLDDDVWAKFNQIAAKGKNWIG